jgi:serine protease Do
MTFGCKLKTALLVACFTLFSHVCFAESLAPLVGQAWLTVASTQNLDEAIGIAGLYGEGKSKVVTSRSGWYAVVLGPYPGKSISGILQRHAEIGQVPRDARLSGGENYLEVVWDSTAFKPVVMTGYDAVTSAEFRDSANTFSITMTGDEDNPGPSTATGTSDTKTLFQFATSNEFSIDGASAAYLLLDPNSVQKQLLFTRFTGGAHCCTQTWIVTQPRGDQAWVLVETPMLDSSGYRIEDVDGDGGLELLSVDNDFLYAFDSYAASFAPLRIQQLRGEKLIDVSQALSFQSQLWRDLAAMEFNAKLDPELWRSNGFLAGWFAAKMRLGQGDEAWVTVEKNFDPNTDFGPQQCQVNLPLQECPAEELQKVPALAALAMFLAERDYGPLPEAARGLLP